MGTEEACADDELVVKKEKSISIPKVVPLPQSCSSLPAADHHIPDSNPIGPPTPDFNRELVEGLLLLDHEFSSSPSATTVCNHTDGNSSETPPKETLFDSFAPGPDNLMLAHPPPPPHHRKYREKELRIKHVVRRQLNFMCETNLIRDITTSHMDSDMEHDHLFQIVYGTILDAIVSDHETKKEEGGGGGGGAGDAGFESGFDGLGTPAPHLLLCGIAETCPRAPIKSTNKYRNNIDKGICKKLEF